MDTTQGIGGNGGRRRRPRWIGLGLAAVAAAAAVVPGQAVAAETASGYIVVLREGAQTRAAAVDGLARRHGGTVEHRYTAALSGFSTSITPSRAKALAKDPSVAYVVPDTPVHALGDQPNPPSWGLDRIDQVGLPLNANYHYENTAPAVKVYVIDTGVRANHVDFGRRVVGGYDFVDNDANPDDGNGHGTFMAGVAGGTAHGVAKGVTIVPVRVLNNSGSGTTSGVIAGIDWVTANASGPSVANMSLGGAANTALDNAVRNSIASGVTYSVASGSSASDAGNYSPSRVSQALVTAAVDRNGCATSNSNYGRYVDLYAPGRDITSTWITSTTATNTISGSSTAAAHTSGAAALRLGANPALTPAQVAALLVGNASPGVCSLPPNSPNRILYTGPFPY